MAVFLDGAGLHRRGRAAGVGFGDADCGLVAVKHQFTGLLYLPVAAVAQDGADRTHVAFDHDPAGDAAALREFLDHEHRVQTGGPLAPQRPGNGHAHEFFPHHLPDGIPGVFLGPVGYGGHGCGEGLGEFTGLCLQRLLFPAERETGLPMIQAVPAGCRLGWRLVHGLNGSEFRFPGEAGYSVRTILGLPHSPAWRSLNAGPPSARGRVSIHPRSPSAPW